MANLRELRKACGVKEQRIQANTKFISRCHQLNITEEELATKADVSIESIYLLNGNSLSSDIDKLKIEQALQREEEIKFSLV